MRLLFVEDDPVAREFVQRVPQHRGFAVDECGDGNTGLRKALTERFERNLIHTVKPVGFVLEDRRSRSHRRCP